MILCDIFPLVCITKSRSIKLFEFLFTRCSSTYCCVRSNCMNVWWLADCIVLWSRYYEWYFFQILYLNDSNLSFNKIIEKVQGFFVEYLNIDYIHCFNLGHTNFIPNKPVIAVQWNATIMSIHVKLLSIQGKYILWN